METATLTLAQAARVPRVRLGRTADGGRGVAAIVVAVAAAVVGSGVILEAGFLIHPVWLALQRADLIVVGVVVGVYWRMRRPQSRFGSLLIGWGFLAAVLPLEAVGSSLVHTLAAFVETVFGLWTVWLVLAFPTGLVDGPVARAALAIVATAYISLGVLQLLLGARLQGSVLAACRTTCPHNPFAVSSDPHLLTGASRIAGAVYLAGIVLAGVVLISRIVATRAPRRPSAAAGTVVCLVFLGAEAAYWIDLLFRADLQADLGGPLRWVMVGSRAFLPWGFFFALLIAELAAGRVLRRMVAVSLGSRSLGDLESALGEAIGDRGLRLGLWRGRERAYVDARGEPLPGAPTDARQSVIEAHGSDGHAVAVLHADLRDEPELAEAAVTAALLALDNARLELDLDATVDELQRSRARLVAASDAERRRIERDLHDGAQQRLVAVTIKLGIARERVHEDSAITASLTELSNDLEQALRELRELAHGIYPPILADAGLAAALTAAARKSELPVRVEGEVGRYRPEVEAAVYYVCLEALQNAAKHAGAGASAEIAVVERDGQLTFAVADDGCGFDPVSARNGDGLRNMEDRLGAVGGRLAVDSTLGSGTVVSGAVPL